MFKKTLLAASLAALSTGAFAVDTQTGSGTAVTIGSEGLTSGLVANDGSVLNITAAAVDLTLGAEYSVGDIVTITISGGTFAAGAAYTLVDTPATNNETVTWGLLNQTSTALTFRVTSITTAATNDTVVGNTSRLAALAGGGKAADAITVTSTAKGHKVTITAKAETSTGIALDNTSKDTVEVANIIQQHSFAVSPVMAAKIDVSKEREEFVAAGGNVTAPTFTVTHTNANPDQADFGSAASTVSATVTGSMAGFEASIASATNDGTVTGAAAAAYTVAADLQSATRALGTVDLSAANVITAEPVLFTVDPTAADRKALNVDNYTIGFTITEGGKTHTVAGLAGGSMTLNGSSAVFAYAPVGFDSVTTQFEIGNSGAVDGDITISGFDTDGNDYSAALPFKAEAGKLTRVSDADIVEALGLTGGTKLKLTITVNAPDADITYGAYSNRGTTGRMAINKL